MYCLTLRYRPQALTRTTDDRNLKILSRIANEILCTALIRPCVRAGSVQHHKMGETDIVSICCYVVAIPTVRLECISSAHPNNLWIIDTISVTHQTDGPANFSSDQWRWRGDNHWLTWEEYVHTYVYMWWEGVTTVGMDADKWSVQCTVINPQTNVYVRMHVNRVRTFNGDYLS